MTTRFHLFLKSKDMGGVLISDCLVLSLFSCFFNFSLGAVKKGQIVRVDKEKYLNSINVSNKGHFTDHFDIFVLYSKKS